MTSTSRCISTISASSTGLLNRLLVNFCRSLDHPSNRVRLGDKDSVACAHFGDLGARPLIHPALQLRTYDLILGGQDRVAGLAAPCRYRDGGAQCFLRELLLRVRQELSFRCRDISRIGFTEFCGRDEEILVRSGTILSCAHGVVRRRELRQKLA